MHLFVWYKMRILNTLPAILLLLLLFSCKNFIGNPHRVAMPPRVVPALAGDVRIEPANWWTGMRHNRVEVLFRRAGLSEFQVRLGKSKGVKILAVEKGDSPNYVFVTLEISPKAKAQKVPVVFSKGDYVVTCEFPILDRSSFPKAQGVNSRDVVYTIYPDRFANGDPSNDLVPGMHQGPDRSSPNGRHGGDLQGIAGHLDYLQELGITAVWLNPELENDQTQDSYHGYAATDLYRVDRRFGTNLQLRDLVAQCHRRGIKFIRDAVPNHIGDQHYWMQDLPFKDWVNPWPEITRTNFRAPTAADPYASEYDRKHFHDGWFDARMPDLNQRNPHVAAYLIQQSIWWIEYAGLDGFRIDSYAYPDPAFSSRWCREIREEYPDFGMFGEVWDYNTIVQGFFADDQPMQRAGFDSNLPGVVDFQLCFAIREALTREQGWTEGVARVYCTLAQDYFYRDPFRNVVMLDNHDMTRFWTFVGENLGKYKTGIAFLLTTRGIPQIYYGTEILATGNKDVSDGDLRKDFPGGWPGDPVNKFVAEGRTERENEAFQFLKTLLHYRNATPALQTGKLVQFIPEEGVYVYFRYDDAKTVMIVLNTSDKDVNLSTVRFAERMQGFSKAKNVLTGEVLNDLSRLEVGKYSPMVLEMMPEAPK